jgi:hypothetical protein
MKNALYDPIVELQRILSYPSDILLEGYLRLADIFYILGSYKTSLKWLSKALGTNGTNGGILLEMGVLQDVLRDMSLLFEILANKEISEIFHEKCKSLCADSEQEQRTSMPVLLPNDNIIFSGEQTAFDWMNRYVPQLVIAKTLKYESAVSRIRMRTLAYGASLNVDACFEGIKTLCREGVSFDHTDFFYFPMYLLNSKKFWSLLDCYKPEMLISTSNFDVCRINTKDSAYGVSYGNFIVPLHCARSGNDYAKMWDISQTCNTWNDPHLCLRFYKTYHRMPTWIEYYSLLYEENATDCIVTCAPVDS